MKERVALAGTAVFVRNEKKEILVGVRLSIPGYGNNEWQLPGGKIAHMEDWLDTAKREVFEETGLEVNNVKFITSKCNRWKFADKHFITSFFTADVCGGKLEVKEPTKCFLWKWVNVDEIPDPTFLTLRDVVNEFRDKIIE